MKAKTGFAIVLSNGETHFYYTGGYGKHMFSSEKTKSLMFDFKDDAEIELEILREEDIEKDIEVSGFEMKVLSLYK